MNISNILSICIVIILSSCIHEDESTIYSDECIDCNAHTHQQIYNNNVITLELDSRIYCIGDSAWSKVNGSLWMQLDEELINIMVQGGYCDFIELESN